MILEKFRNSSRVIAQSMVLIIKVDNGIEAGQLSWLERRANNANVAGSIPVLAILFSKHIKVDAYGTCTCGEGAELTNGVCACPDGLILDGSGTICYNGIDSTFDQTQEGF